MRIELTSSIDFINRKEWNEVDSNVDLFNSYDWLRITENSEPPFYLDPLYMQVKSGNSNILCGVGYFFDKDWKADDLQRVDYFLEGLENTKGKINSSQFLPSMNIGGWTCTNTNFLIERSLENKKNILSQTVNAMENEGTKADVNSICYKYVDKENYLLREVLKELGYEEYKTASRFEMNVKGFTTFSDYIESLTSKRKNDVKQDIRKIKESSILFEYTNLYPQIASTLAQLTAQTSRKNGSNPSEDSLERWFLYLAKQKSIHTKVILAKLEKQIIGFSLSIEFNNRLYVLYCGFDYTLKKNLPLYFPLVFYEPIKYSINNKLNNISFSISADKTKLRKGCQKYDQYTYIKRC